MEHAVLIDIPLDDATFGSKDARAAMFALEDELIRAVEASGLGEFDGNDFGQGECKFYIYGSNADALYRAVEPVLKANASARGGYAMKRYGPAMDPESKEIRVSWLSQ